MTDFEKEWELFKAAHEEKPLTHEEFVRSVQDACLWIIRLGVEIIEEKKLWMPTECAESVLGLTLSQLETLTKRL